MPPIFFEEFGRRCTRRRHILRLTQREVAAAIGTQRSHVSALEHGRQVMMRLDQLMTLARTLKTSSDYLLQVVDVDPGEVPPRLCPGRALCCAGDTLSPVTTLPERSLADAEYTRHH